MLNHAEFTVMDAEVQVMQGSRLPQPVVSACPIPEVPAMAVDRLWISRDGRCGLQAKGKIVVFFNRKYLCFYAVLKLFYDVMFIVNKSC